MNKQIDDFVSVCRNGKVGIVSYRVFRVATVGELLAGLGGSVMPALRVGLLTIPFWQTCNTLPLILQSKVRSA